jgi:hypothetical protein
MAPVKIRPDETSLSRVHYELIRGLIENGSCPSNFELVRRLDMASAQIEQLLQELSEIHGAVLHPHICEPWVVHPFSLTPTLHWITGSQGSWWAPCVWCALGITTLVQGETQIHTRFVAEAGPLIIRVINGQPVDLEDVWVTLQSPLPEPGRTFTITARWFFPSAHGQTFMIGALGTDSHAEKEFHCIKWLA